MRLHSSPGAPASRTARCGKIPRPAPTRAQWWRQSTGFVRTAARRGNLATANRCPVWSIMGANRTFNRALRLRAGTQWPTVHLSPQPSRYQRGERLQPREAQHPSRAAPRLVEFCGCRSTAFNMRRSFSSWSSAQLMTTYWSFGTKTGGIVCHGQCEHPACLRGDEASRLSCA